MMAALCERYGTLPWPGSMLEQPAIPFLRMHNILALGASESTPQKGPEADLAALMVPL